MAKTQEELNALKEKVESLNKMLAELTEEELAQVTGGTRTSYDPSQQWKELLLDILKNK